MSVVTHRLKAHPAAFYAVRDGLKTFEVRKNDRLFQSGDYVELTFWDPNNPEGERDLNELGECPREITRRIGWILGGGQYGVEAGHVAFTLEDPSGRPARIDEVTDMLKRLYTQANAVRAFVNADIGSLSKLRKSPAFPQFDLAVENAAKLLFVESLPVDVEITPEGGAHA